MTESTTTPTFHTAPVPAAPSLKAKLLRPVVLIPAAAVLALGSVGGAVAIGASQQAAAQASASQSAAAAQTVFVQQWHDEFPNVPASDDAGAVVIGQRVCDAYRAGTTFTGEVQYLMAQGFDAEHAGAIIGMATSSFCPEFNNRH